MSGYSLLIWSVVYIEGFPPAFDLRHGALIASMRTSNPRNKILENTFALLRRTLMSSCFVIGELQKSMALLMFLASFVPLMFPLSF